ncbi:hypothetical protein M1373_02235 [Candidatus Marsarchaeota archaeon]|nr:hypothetical protein [Candidatus Marsarchaeota archaeon]MCL5404837.1 hypothetical protein [Candidatus Marsarchaeota archaeon]
MGVSIFEESIKKLQLGFVSGRDKNGYQKIEYKISIDEEKLQFLTRMYEEKLNGANTAATPKCEFEKGEDIEKIFGEGTGILTIRSTFLYPSNRKKEELEKQITEIGQYLENASKEPVQLIRK